MKGFILGIITVLIVGGVGYYAYQYGKGANPITPIFTSTPVATSTVSDADLIKNALYQKNKWQDMGITITIKTNDGTYASGSVNGQGGGGYFYAIKVTGVWKIVADGNGIISCADLAPYPDYPKSLIPECFDQSTQNIVNR
jgi:hypothetical protein